MNGTVLLVLHRKSIYHDSAQEMLGRVVNGALFPDVVHGSTRGTPTVGETIQMLAKYSYR